MNKYKNNAAIREALVKIREYIITGNTGYEPKELLELILNWCDSSLAESPRNCDVGTVEEQVRRKREYCKETQCSGCPASKGGTISTDRCDFTWAQMPFDSKGKCEDAQSGNGFNPKDYYEKLLEDPTVRALFEERHGYGLSGKDERNSVK